MQPAAQWGEGYGSAPNHASLDWFAQQFGVHYSSDLPKPYLYPTPEGGVQVEWCIGPLEVSLEIDLDARSGDWHSLNMDSDDEDERDLDLNDAEGWCWFTDELLDQSIALADRRSGPTTVA